MISTKDFMNKPDFDRAVAERAARASVEGVQRKRHHDRAAANSEAMTQALAGVPTTSAFPWLSLSSLDHHPDVRTANAAVLAAETNLTVTVTGIEVARAELTIAEEAAARGDRNDTALRRAREQVQGFESDVRIAETAVRLAKQEQLEVLRRVTFACAANLQVLHEAELLDFDAALLVARKHSQRLEELERKSRQLIDDSPYTHPDRKWARHLRRVSWRTEFSKGGYLDYWRKYFGLSRAQH